MTKFELHKKYANLIKEVGVDEFIENYYETMRKEMLEIGIDEDSFEGIEFVESIM